MTAQSPTIIIMIGTAAFLVWLIYSAFKTLEFVPTDKSTAVLDMPKSKERLAKERKFAALLILFVVIGTVAALESAISIAANIEPFGLRVFVLTTSTIGIFTITALVFICTIVKVLNLKISEGLM